MRMWKVYKTNKCVPMSAKFLDSSKFYCHLLYNSKQQQRFWGFLKQLARNTPSGTPKTFSGTLFKDSGPDWNEPAKKFAVLMFMRGKKTKMIFCTVAEIELRARSSFEGTLGDLAARVVAATLLLFQYIFQYIFLYIF